MSTTRIHSDILAVAPEMWVENLGNDPVWEDKKYETLLWRGTTTGTRVEEDMPYWRLSQRLRMVEMTNQQTGTYDVLMSTDYNNTVGEPLTVEVADLNEDLMDIGFSGQPVQCSPEVCATIAREYKFREAQSWEEANDYKYLLDASTYPPKQCGFFDTTADRCVFVFGKRGVGVHLILGKRLVCKIQAINDEQLSGIESDDLSRMVSDTVCCAHRCEQVK